MTPSEYLESLSRPSVVVCARCRRTFRVSWREGDAGWCCRSCGAETLVAERDGGDA